MSGTELAAAVAAYLGASFIFAVLMGRWIKRCVERDTYPLEEDDHDRPPYCP